MPESCNELSVQRKDAGAEDANTFYRDTTLLLLSGRYEYAGFLMFRFVAAGRRQILKFAFQCYRAKPDLSQQLCTQPLLPVQIRATTQSLPCLLPGYTLALEARHCAPRQSSWEFLCGRENLTSCVRSGRFNSGVFQYNLGTRM